MQIVLEAGPCDGEVMELAEPIPRRIEVGAPVSLYEAWTEPPGSVMTWERCTYEVMVAHADGPEAPCLHPLRTKLDHVRYRYCVELGSR